MPEELYDKKIVLVCKNGAWTMTKCEIREGAIPLTIPDVTRIRRVVKMEQSKRSRELILKARMVESAKKDEVSHV